MILFGKTFRQGKIDFYVTDDPKGFNKMASMFLNTDGVDAKLVF